MKKSIKEKGITLIALIVTIIIILIIAGVSIGITMNSEGLFQKTKTAVNVTNYKSAYEKLQIKLLEIRMTCEQENKNYNIEEIKEKLWDDPDFTIIKAFYKDVAKARNNVERNKANLKEIVVVVEEQEEYKFLVGETGNIEGTTDKATNTDEEVNNLTENDFVPTETYKAENVNPAPVTPTVEPLYIFNNGTVSGYTWTSGTYSEYNNDDYRAIKINSTNISYPTPSSASWNCYAYCNERIENKYSKLKLKLTFAGAGEDYSKISVFIRPDTSHDDEYTYHMLPRAELNQYYVGQYLTNSDNANYATENVMEISLNDVPSDVQDYCFYIHTSSSTWAISQIWFE